MRRVAHFIDTSALGKYYQQEPGTAAVDGPLATPGGRHYVSRLMAAEVPSALAKKVRVGQLTAADFRLLTRRFRADVTAKRFQVVRLLVPHFHSAERLTRRIGVAQNLRTLDALQLAVALSLNEPGRPVVFVRADQPQCSVASAEGLAVANPELP